MLSSVEMRSILSPQNIFLHYNQLSYLIYSSLVPFFSKEKLHVYRVNNNFFSTKIFGSFFHRNMNLLKKKTVQSKKKNYVFLFVFLCGYLFCVFLLIFCKIVMCDNILHNFFCYIFCLINITHPVLNQSPISKI